MVILEELEIKSNSCSCDACIKMCNCYPCQPTPKEAYNLIKVGYAKRLMLKAWPAKNNPKLVIPSLVPAIVGYEMGVGPLQQYKGSCTFLNKDNLCELHQQGLKPAEGRFARHDTPKEQEEDLMREIMQLWIRHGEKVFDKWETICQIKIQGPIPS
jgi:hypothetical protein